MGSSKVLCEKILNEYMCIKNIYSKVNPSFRHQESDGKHNFRQRHPEAVPRRGRRLRPPSPEPCTMPTVEPPISFKDVLVKFAKMSQNEPQGPRLPYPEVTLHPVPPPLGPASSLLQGILTKPGNRATNFSPTLARLLTAPERPSQPAAPVAAPAVSISDLLGPSKVSTVVCT